MTREMIIEELVARGYKVTPQDTIKNGVSCRGILFQMDSNISPVVYVKSFIDEAKENKKCIDDVVENILAQLEWMNTEIPSLNLEKIEDKQFILTHLYIGLQKESEEPLVKKACRLEGIESYLYIREGYYFIKLNETIMEKNGITVEEAWENAEKNTFEETEIETMKGMFGCNVEAMCVVTNRDSIRGASAILDSKKISEVAKKYGVNKLVCLPSSVHEMIIIPCKENEDKFLEFFSNMVAKVNQNEVEPEERLTDRAYILTI